MPQRKNIYLVKLLSITSFFIGLVLSVVYLFLIPYKSLGFQILGISALFFAPYILVRIGYINFGRVFFCYFAPIVVLAISVFNKLETMGLEESNPVDFFDVRIMLILTMVIPFATIDIRETRLLFYSVLPSLLSVTFFDPIHNSIGIGFYQFGLESKDYYVSANLFTIFTYLFIALAFFFLKRESRKVEDRLLAKSLNLQNYLDYLLTLNNSQNIQNGNLNEAAKEIAQTISDSLNVDRITIWNYSERTNWLVSIIKFQDGKIHTEEEIIDVSQFPNYMKELQKNEIICADEVSKHPALSEMVPYLEENNIKSMLDAPFFSDGKIKGVVCLEHQQSTRYWTPEDQLFVKAISDFLSYAIIMANLTEQYEVVKEKSFEINEMNNNLAQNIDKRTNELLIKNEQLSEYAFLNSHKLRGPIARIEGLFNVLELTQMDKIPKEIIEPIRDSINELDQVSRQINKSIEHYGMIDSEHMDKVLYGK